MMKKGIKIVFCEQSERTINECRNYFWEKGIRPEFCEKDGNKLLGMIKELKPDVVVTDVFLSGKDAIEVKREADKLVDKPKLFFATCAFDNDDTLKQVMDAGFNYYFLKPYSMENLYNRIETLSEDRTEMREIDEEGRVTQVLHEMGVPAHIKGYGFLRQAIIMAMNEPEVINLVTKRLYPDIRKANHTTASRVERAIRRAIEIAWEKGNREVICKFFWDYIKCKPANSRLIAVVADRLRLERKGYNSIIHTNRRTWKHPFLN